MKVEGEGTLAGTPVWIGYRSYSVSTPDGRSIYVVIPKKTFEKTPERLKVTIEWD